MFKKRNYALARTVLHLFVDLYICSQANEEIINVLSTLIYFSLSGNDGKHTALISSNILKTGEQTGLIGNPIL